MLKIARQDPVDFNALTRVIATDASLSSLLIRRANSSRFGVRRPITELSRALISLGRDHVIELAMVEAARGLRVSARASWPGGNTPFWKHAVAVAITARALATGVGMPYPEEAFMCGLLHDYGKLVMLAHSPDAYSAMFSEAQRSGKPLHKAEHQILGLTHADVGGAVCRLWQLPDSLTHAVKTHHEKADIVLGTLGNLVRSANLLVKVAQIGEAGSPFIAADNFDRMPHVRLSPPTLRELLVELPQKVDELASHILGRDEETPAAAPALGSGTGTIHIDIAQRDESRLVEYTLLAMGVPSSAVFPGALPERLEGAVLITDHPASYADHDQILDYQTWRRNQRPDPENYLDSVALRRWLSEALIESEPVSS